MLFYFLCIIIRSRSYPRLYLQGSTCPLANRIRIYNALFEFLSDPAKGGAISIECSESHLVIQEVLFSSCFTPFQGSTTSTVSGAVNFIGATLEAYRFCGINCSSYFHSFGKFDALKSDSPNFLNGSTITQCPGKSGEGFQNSLRISSTNSIVTFTNLNSSLNVVLFHGASIQSFRCFNFVSNFFTLFNTTGENSLDFYYGKSTIEYSNFIENNQKNDKKCLVFTNSYENTFKNIIFIRNHIEGYLFSQSSSQENMRVLIIGCISDKSYQNGFNSFCTFDVSIQVKETEKHIINHLNTHQCGAEIPLPTSLFTAPSKSSHIMNIGLLLSHFLLNIV